MEKNKSLGQLIDDNHHVKPIDTSMANQEKSDEQGVEQVISPAENNNPNSQVEANQINHHDIGTSSIKESPSLLPAESFSSASSTTSTSSPFSSSLSSPTSSSENITSTKNQVVTFLEWYHPYRNGNNIMHQELDKNFQFDVKQNSGTQNYKTIETYIKPFKKMIAALEKKDESLLMIVPGSQKGSFSPILTKIVADLCHKHQGRYMDGYRILHRRENVEKLAKGGPRDIKIHLKSIEVNDTQRLLKKSTNIIVLDDVATSGNSLKACERLIKQDNPNATVQFYTMVMTCTIHGKHTRNDYCECYPGLTPKQCTSFTMSMMDALPKVDQESKKIHAERTNSTTTNKFEATATKEENVTMTSYTKIDDVEDNDGDSNDK